MNALAKLGGLAIADPDAGFIAAFLDIAATQPARVYASFEGMQLTFGELADRSAAFAAYLQESGLRDGERVALFMRNSADMIAAVFGIARAGLVWVPVNSRQLGAGLAYVFEHSDSRLIVCDDDLVQIAELANTAGVPVLVRSKDAGKDTLGAVLRSGASYSGRPPAGHAILAIMYTSGTTGRPKGVVVTQLMLVLAAQAVVLAAEAGPDAVFFVWEPLYHIGGAQLLPLPIFHGIDLQFADRFSASTFWKHVKQVGATHIHHLGGILQILLKQPASPDDRTHGVKIAWGGGCPPEIWLAFEERFGVDIRECYGMTECASIATVNVGGPVGSIGRAVPWFAVEVLDEELQPCPPNRRGQIVVTPILEGACFSSYWENTEATGATLRDGKLYTGDFGHADAEGYLYFGGRMTDSVRCRGENVSAWEVEQVVAQHPGVEECAVIGLPAEIGEQDIKLYVKPREGTDLDIAGLSAWLGTRLASYQLPRYIALTEGFEKTASQRIIKSQLSKATDDCWTRDPGA